MRLKFVLSQWIPESCEVDFELNFLIIKKTMKMNRYLIQFTFSIQ